MGGEGDNGVETSGVEKSTIHIRCSNGSKFTVEADLGSNVGAFKVFLAEKCDVPADQQRLIYKGRILKDDNSLESYGLQSEHTVHLVRGSSASASATVATEGNTVTSNSTPGPARGVPSSNNGGFGGSGLGSLLFPGLGANGLGGNGSTGIFGAGLPDFQQAQQQLTQNPNMIREMMNMPAIQNLMNNPDLMRNLIMSNPQMREIIDRNPDLAHILNDPGTLRQTLDAARNPELMREMMRNTDRAMSNIESSPEGFNMLRRMYETVQEPFLNATTMAGDGGNDSQSNPFAALFGAQGLGQDRAQTQTPSTTNSDTTTGMPAPNTNPLPNPWNPTSNAPGTGAAAGQATIGSRAASVAGARQPGIGGMPGLGLPDFGGMGGGVGLLDPATLQQMLQNPAIMQMMQGLLSNPQYINQIMNSFPQFRPLLDSNTQLREMMQSPEFLRQLTSPESMQQLLSLQQAFMSQLNRQQPGQVQGQTGEAGQTGVAGGNNFGLESLLGMFGGLGGLNTPNVSDVPPEQLYATQLSQLQEMGFYDTQENIRALSATGGNVHAAVERLLGNLD